MLCAGLQIFVHMALAFDLTDKSARSEIPADIFLQAAGGRIKGSESVFHFIPDRLAVEIFLPNRLH